MASIATLTIDLIGKSAKLTAELKKANKSTKSWSDKTRQMVGTTTKFMAGFGTAGVAAFTAIYAKNAAFIDQQAKTADRLGITTEALSGLQHAAQQTGASTESLNMGLQRMTRRIGQVAATGKGEAKVALDQLGISIDDIKSKSPDEQFALIAEKMSDVSDQGQKVFLTQKLFDSEGVKLLNTLNLGADGIQTMMNEAEALGLAISRVDAAKVEIANDAFDRAQKSTHSFGQALATETAPLVAAISDMFTESAIEAGGFGQLAQTVVTKVGKGLGFLSDMGRGLQVTFLLLRQAVAELGNGAVQLFNGLYQAGGGMLEYLGMDVSSTKDMQAFADGFSGTTDQLAGELEDLLAAPMPSEKIGAWIADVQQKFETQAKAQVKKGKNDLNHLLLGDNSSNNENDSSGKVDALVEKARSQYQKIYEAQLELEGNEIELENRKYNRLVEKMDAEIQLLRDKNLATQEIEEEYRVAKEQLELQHKERLGEQNNDFWSSYTESVRNSSAITDELWADTLSNFSRNVSNNITNSIFEWKGFGNLVENIAVSFGKSMIQTLVEIGTQRTVLWALEKTIGKANSASYITQVAGQAQAGAHLAAINAFASTAAIPIVGPAMAPGAAALAEAATQPLAAAAIASAASSLASFDGGGYTGDGARIGGVDGKGGMFAIVHPKETVIDHTKGQSLGNKVTINLIEDASRAGQNSKREMSGEDVIDVFVSNIREGGSASGALESHYGLQRQGL